MKKLGLVLILILFTGILPATAKTDNTLLTRFGTATIGANETTLTDGKRTISESWTLEQLKETGWLNKLTEDSCISDKTLDKITRRKTDTTATLDVEYINQPDGIKILAKSTIEETGVYRLVWIINGGTVEYLDETGCQFTDGYGVDWSDVKETIGEIYQTTITENGIKVTFLIGKLEAGETYTLDPYLIDSYSETNYTSYLALRNVFPSAAVTYSSVGQAIVHGVTNDTLVTASFWLAKDGLPVGNMYARLYATTGDVGVDAKPTGLPLATSLPIPAASLTDPAYALTTFYFNTSNQYEMIANTNYSIAVMVLDATLIGVGDEVRVGIDATGADPNGQLFWYSTSAWGVTNTADTIFYLYGGPTPENLDLQSTPVFSKDTPGWVNVTVSTVPPVTELSTVTIQVNTTGDSQNFTLRWTQATDAFSEVSDLDNICELNTESVRANINTTTDLISFNFNITAGQSGLCDVLVTTIDDTAFSDIDLYSNAFKFSYFNWNPTADKIDSLFEQFGIIGYFTIITAWIEGISSKFQSSLTRVLALILLQFTVIEQVFTFFTGWATDLFAIALTFSTFYHQIMDGTSPWIQPIYAIGNFWDLIGYDSWAPAVPMLLFIWWLNSMPKRAAQTVGGEFQVFINDLNTAMGLISYFVSIFSYVANTIIDYVLRILPGVT